MILGDPNEMQRVIEGKAAGTHIMISISVESLGIMGNRGYEGAPWVLFQHGATLG